MGVINHDVPHETVLTLWCLSAPVLNMHVGHQCISVQLLYRNVNI